MKLIKLTKGFFTKVDDDDFENFNKYKWHINSHGYAVRSKYLGIENGKQKLEIIFLHRLVINTPKGMFTDHLNHNKIDNRKQNLRICNQSQNLFNSNNYCSNTSGFKGVTKSKNKWRARIYPNGKCIELGSYKTKEEAFGVYKEKLQSLIDSQR